MIVDAVELARALIRKPSVTPADAGAMDVLQETLVELGFDCRRMRFGEIENLQVSVKGPADFVSKADHNAEKIVHAELSKARPTYGFLMEEGGEIKGTDGQHRWIIDPLDGTTNFLHGIPLFAVAIALQRGDEIVASVIYNPVLEELYVAEKGGGAWLDDKKRLRVAGRKHLADAVIVTGINSRGSAIAPLSASRNRTRLPGPFPSTRRTFVAPGFLLPTSKMFTPFARAIR